MSNNPYLDPAFLSNKKTSVYHELWEEGRKIGYRDAKKEFEPIPFSKELPSSGLEILAYDKDGDANILEFRTKYGIIRNEYSEVVDGVYIYENPDFYLYDSNCDRFNKYTHWLPIPKLKNKTNIV
jgi:hypothetical protein